MARWRRTAPFLPLLMLSGVFYHFWNVSYERIVPRELSSIETFNEILFVDLTSNALEQPLPQPVPPPMDPLPPARPLSVHYPSPAPRITIIALWSSRENPVIYLPQFFASVAANPSLDILFIKFDKHNVGGCEEPLAPGISNVREICLSMDEYWDLHANFLCKRWGCNSADRKALMEKMWERAPGDRVNSYFRPFRAAIFNKWVNPDTKIWGWCDLDTMLGNFERTFPWDVADDFDMLVPGAPINGNDVLLYLPGHLAFFRNAPHIVDQFMTFPNLRTLDAYLNLPWISSDSEEVEYSHFAFLNTNFTFLRFDAMVFTRYHLSSPGNGVYNIENDYWWDLSPSVFPSTPEVRSLANDMIREHESRWKPKPTFSDNAVEYEVELRVGGWPHWAWFPHEFAVDFPTDYEKFRGGLNRYVMRRTPGGPVYDRQEFDEVMIFPPFEGGDPNVHYHRGNRPFIREQLYNHFQNEKYRDWWSLPERPTVQGEILMMDKDQGAQVWDSQGTLVFDTASKRR